jgi:hypothetical protein
MNAANTYADFPSRVKPEESSPARVSNSHLLWAAHMSRSDGKDFTPCDDLALPSKFARVW